MTIHTFTPDAWQVMRDLRLRALADAPNAFASTLVREQAFTEDGWRQRAGREGGFWADHDGEPGGIAGTFLAPEPLARQTVDDWSRHPALVSMWVAPEHRGSHMAADLVDAVTAHVRRKGATRLWLWVAEGNDRAIGFYRRLGFTETGERQLVRPGEPAYELRMVRDLTTGSELRGRLS